MRESKSKQLNLVLLDTSGSSTQAKGLNDALGAVTHLYKQSYLDRHDFGLITFGNNKVEWLVRPQKANRTFGKHLTQVSAGGGTPLAEALRVAEQFSHKYGRNDQGNLLNVYIVTDGLTRQPVSNVDINATTHVIDVDRSAIRLNKAQDLANELCGSYIHIDSLEMTHPS